MSDEERPLTAEEVRAQFPTCVAWADQVRKVFGPGVRMRYAKEGGRELGAPCVQPGVVVVTLEEMGYGKPVEPPPPPPGRKGRRNG